MDEAVDPAPEIDPCTELQEVDDATRRALTRARAPRAPPSRGCDARAASGRGATPPDRSAAWSTSTTCTSISASMIVAGSTWCSSTSDDGRKARSPSTSTTKPPFTGRVTVPATGSWLAFAVSMRSQDRCLRAQEYERATRPFASSRRSTAASTASPTPGTGEVPRSRRSMTPTRPSANLTSISSGRTAVTSTSTSFGTCATGGAVPGAGGALRSTRQVWRRNAENGPAPRIPPWDRRISRR